MTSRSETLPDKATLRHQLYVGRQLHVEAAASSITQVFLKLFHLTIKIIGSQSLFLARLFSLLGLLGLKISDSDIHVLGIFESQFQANTLPLTPRCSTALLFSLYSQRRNLVFECLQSVIIRINPHHVVFRHLWILQHGIDVVFEGCRHFSNLLHTSCHM